MREAKPTWQSLHEFQLQALEDKLTKILGSKIMSDEQKEKLRIKYNNEIEKMKQKIEKDKMKSK